MEDGAENIQIPGFEMLLVCGTGGMSTVWEARQLSLEREVALKILSPDLVQDPQALKLFHQEARSTAKLKHPGIVQVYDAGEHNGMAYIVMEFLSEGTVGDRLERKELLPEEDGLAILESLARALQYAWDEARIIHCDIKPDNIMIDRDGTIHVADLGLARIVNTMAKDTRLDSVMGTPNYISPEQAQGHADLDCRTDIYAAGAMLYHMITGHIPFPNENIEYILESQVSGYLADPIDLNPKISNGTGWLIEKMMAKDRENRYQSWNEVLEDLPNVRKRLLPASYPLEEGLSTVLRGERRCREPAPPQKGPQGRKKILISQQTREEINKYKPRRSGFGRIFAWALLWIVLLGSGSYFTWQHLQKSQQEPVVISEEEFQENLPPRSYRPEKKNEDAGEQIEAGNPVELKKVQTVPIQTAEWNNTAFRTGATAFNTALKDYKHYQATRNNPAILKSVEQNCRISIEAFENCRDEAPPKHDMDFYIKQAYQLISDCRQSTLLDVSKEDNKRRAAPELPPHSWER